MKLPDGPTKTPRMLRFLKLILQPIDYLEQYQNQYGDCFAVMGRNNTPLVYVSHPQIMQKIFSPDSQEIEDMSGGNRALEYLLGDRSLLFLTGDRHRQQRQLLTPPFHGERMRAYGRIICEIARSVMGQQLPNGPFPIREVTQEISLQAILRLVFGLTESDRFQPLKKLLTTLLEAFNSPLFSSLLFFDSLQQDWGPWSPWGRFLRLKQQIDALLYTEIQQRREHFDPNRQDILTLLLQAKDETGQGMTDEELRDELMTLLVAGHDTTASALAWAFYWVDYYPEIREKILFELKTLQPDADPSAIAKLPYLSAVCSETLRIYPIAINGVFRKARSPIQIMGYEFPENTLFMPSIYMAHHREETYPEPKKFKPERFLERQYSPYEYFPFGGGNRRCIGSAFAQFEMKLVLATILSQYQLARVDRSPVKPVRRGLTIAPPSNLKMISTPIEPPIPLSPSF